MTLQRALLVSTALHGVLLLVVPQRHSSEHKVAEPSVLVARLVQPATTLSPVELEAPRPIKPIRLPKRAAPIAPPGEPPQQSSVQETVSQQPRAEEEQVLASAEPPPAVQVAEMAQFDQGAIARYRLQIISAARNFRRYPPIARENGWQGRAEVRVSFDGAREPAIVINRSSGYAVLDRQAVETLSKALAPLPAPLAGRAFELDFPVVFSLDE